MGTSPDAVGPGFAYGSDKVTAAGPSERRRTATTTGGGTDEIQLRFLVAIACLTTVSLATPSTAGGGLPKDCKRAGLKTQEDCNAFLAARGNKPAVTPSAKAPPTTEAAGATTGSGNPSALDALLKAAGGGVAGALTAAGAK